MPVLVVRKKKTVLRAHSPGPVVQSLPLVADTVSVNGNSLNIALTVKGLSDGHSGNLNASIYRARYSSISINIKASATGWITIRYPKGSPQGLYK
jgi:hypothetical protein